MNVKKKKIKYFYAACTQAYTFIWMGNFSNTFLVFYCRKKNPIMAQNKNLFYCIFKY